MLIVLFRVQLGGLLHPVEVGPGGEGLAIAAQDHHPDGFLIGDRVEGVGQFLDDQRIEGIVHVGPVQRDDREAFLRGFKADGFVNGVCHAES